LIQNITIAFRTERRKKERKKERKKRKNEENEKGRKDTVCNNTKKKEMVKLSMFSNYQVKICPSISCTHQITARTTKNLSLMQYVSLPMFSRPVGPLPRFFMLETVV
jgi:hypothetical protein